MELNHTIVRCRDKHRSATFLAFVLGLDDPRSFGPFRVVEVANRVSLDFHDTDDEIVSQHYAFLVTEEEFDRIFDRVQQLGLDHWADPGLLRRGQINRNDGGRGMYFHDPDGHLLEAVTRPYGST